MSVSTIFTGLARVTGQHNYVQWRIQDFPLGGGGADLRHGCFLAKTYAKTKELDPVGGCVPAAPPGSANDVGQISRTKQDYSHKNSDFMTCHGQIRAHHHIDVYTDIE